MPSLPRPAWTPLRNPRFRALWIASASSHIGSYMTDVGQGWLMSSLTPSPLIVSLLLSAESLPFFIFGLPAGALADIIDRRRLLLVTQIAMAIIIGTLAVLTLTGTMTPWLLLAFSFTLGTATALNDPAWHSIVPEILPAEDLAAGVTLNAVGVNVARSLGPAIGGLIVAAAGPGVVFVLDALSFLGVIATLFSWRREKVTHVLPAERMVGAIRAGLRFARHSDALQRVLLGSSLFMICGAGVMGLMPILGRETGHGATGFGLLLGSLGIGAVTGATLLPRIRARTAPEWVVVAGFVTFAGVAFGAAEFRHLYQLCPTLFLGGIAWISVLSTLNVAAQQASPPWVKARALAVFLIVFQAAIAVGSVLWGIVASHAGLSVAYFGISGGLLAGAAVMAWLKPAAAMHEDHTPARHWPEPDVVGDLPLEAGPIMIQVEYVVEPERADAFRVAMASLGKSRRRSGAMHWWVFQDAADPTRFVETWIEANWAEHLRTHDRVSIAHREIEQRVLELTKIGRLRTTRHLIAPFSRSSTTAAVQSIEERTI